MFKVGGAVRITNVVPGATNRDDFEEYIERKGSLYFMVRNKKGTLFNDKQITFNTLNKDGSNLSNDVKHNNVRNK